MPKRGNKSAGRPQPPGASPAGAARAHSADATSVVTFTALSEAQWQDIRSTRNWPDGPDWRREIEQIGRDYWERLATREMWVKKLQGKQPAKQREKIYKASISMRQVQEALAALVDDGLLDDDFPPISTCRSSDLRRRFLIMMFGFGRSRARATLSRRNWNGI
jgi:hypothetical protein